MLYKVSSCVDSTNLKLSEPGMSKSKAMDSPWISPQVGSVGTQSLRKPGGARSQEAVMGGGSNQNVRSTSWFSSGISPRDRVVANGNL